MKISLWIVGIALPVALVLSACVVASPAASMNLTVAPEAGASADATQPVERIELPDGTVCLFAGAGATLTFDGKRLNYTCEEPVLEQTRILGEPLPGENGEWIVEKAVFTHGEDGFTLVVSETIAAQVVGLALEDGTECLSTGGGATIAFDEKRLNYMCRTEGDDIDGLIGDPRIVNGQGWEAELARIGRSGDGYALEESSVVPVRPVRILVDDTLQCLFAGEGATLAMDGKRLNYTCEVASNEQLGLIGDIVDAGESHWRVEKARFKTGTSGPELVSSEEVTFLLAAMSLADGTLCAFAGEGATITFDGKRVNFTCGASGDNSIVILDDPQPGEGGVWLAEKATLARQNDAFSLASAEMTPISSVRGTDSSADASALKSAPGIPAGVWQWEKTVTSGNSLVEPRDPTLYTLQFEPDGALYIRADCNSGRSSYELSGESLTIGPIALTRVACQPGSLSEPFVGQVANAVSIQVAEDVLTISLLDGGIMTFTQQE